MSSGRFTRIYICCLFTTACSLFLNDATGQKISPPETDNVTDAERAAIRAKAISYYPKLSQLKNKSNARTAAGHVLFGWPMRANTNYDDIPNYYSIINYWDLSSGGAQTDWRCNSRTYDGHNGTDIALWPFWWRMKDNFNVLAVAAAPGIVIDVVENNVDTRCVQSSFTANRVAVLHSDSTISYYLHLKQNGVIVSDSDVVEEGQALAYIASSGRSTYPHLHFQVEDKDGNDIEPFKNTGSPDCNSTTTDTWWKSQKPYWEPQINRVATHSARPTLWGPDDNDADYWCQQHESPSLKNNFSGSDSIYFYLYFHDLQTNDDWDITVTQPNGVDWFSSSGNHSGGNAAFNYYSYARRLPSNALSGTWRVLVSYRNVSYRHYFTVSCVSSYTLTSQTGSYGRIASNFIESTATASNADNVMLQAANEITLKPGFVALQGSTFKARIRDCNFSD